MSDIFQTDEYVVNDNPYLDQGSGGSGADLDSLATSTNAIADADLVVSKEGNTWYKKAASKVWDYIKSKIQASASETAYGTCSTAAATAAKVATLDTASNWKLKKGTIVGIKFTNTNTAQNPTLNVNNSGAKSVYYSTGLITTGTLWAAGVANRFTTFMYDGTNWVWISYGCDNNTTYSNMTTAELLTGTATTQRTMRADYTKPAIEALSTGYGTCSTAAGTAAKVVTMADSNWKLRVGAIINVKFTNTNTFNAASGSPVTLNVNNTGAKNIYYGGSNNPTGTNTTAFGRANYINSYVYDGTNWVWCGSSADNNTTYSAMSKSELTTGTATTSRVVRADYLKAGIEQIAESSAINTANNTATFTSSDTTDANATSWTSVTKLDSGENHASIFAKMSQMFKNIRFLYKMLGTTDISQIGGGNVTGAISALNSALATLSTVDLLFHGHPTTASTFETKSTSSGRKFSDYAFLIFAYRQFSNTLVTVIEPYGIFKTQNSTGSRVMIPWGENVVVEVYYVSDTQLGLKQTLINGDIYNVSVYGVLKIS